MQSRGFSIHFTFINAHPHEHTKPTTVHQTTHTHTHQTDLHDSPESCYHSESLTVPCREIHSLFSSINKEEKHFRFQQLVSQYLLNRQVSPQSDCLRRPEHIRLSPTCQQSSSKRADYCQNTSRKIQLVCCYEALSKLFLTPPAQSRVTTVRLFGHEAPGGASQAPRQSFDVAERAAERGGKHHWGAKVHRGCLVQHESEICFSMLQN